MSNDLQLPPGVIALTTYGSVTMETVDSYAATREAFARSGINNVAWPIIHGSLVDKARNEAVINMLGNPEIQWLFFIDSDMQWHPQAVVDVLATAYRDLPWADVVGGWCPLRGKPYLPTTDPGSGTWEPIAPGTGPVEVMRTGSAFIMIKRHVYEKMQAPWYGIRPAARPLEMLTEVENFALQKFDGKNPLREHEAWGKLEQCAMDDALNPANPLYPFSHVGEDSNFCDKARGLGFRIVVNTNAVVNHVERHLITPEDHLEAFRERRTAERHASGVR